MAEDTIILIRHRHRDIANKIAGHFRLTLRFSFDMVVLLPFSFTFCIYSFGTYSDTNTPPARKKSMTPWLAVMLSPLLTSFIVLNLY